MTQNEPKPRFTGIFIPAEVLEIEELSLLDQMLVSWIDALHCKEHGGCYASNEYLSKKLKVQQNTIVKSMTKLRKMGLIEDVAFDGRRRVIVSRIQEFVARAKNGHSSRTQSYAGCDLNPMQGMTKIPCRVGEKSSPSFIYSKDKIKEEKPGRIPKVRMSQAANADMRLAVFLFDKIKKIDPQAKPNLKQWQDDIEKIIRIDGRTEAVVKQVIEWTFNNSFWRKNILSGRKLREKFQALFIGMNEESSTPQKKESDAADKKQGSLEKNKEWAAKFLENKHFDDTQNRVALKDNAVDVTINGVYEAIGFLEDEFREQVEYFYSKIVNNKEVMCR